MEKISILCASSAYIMNEFSKRTVDGLKHHKLFRLMLPAFTSFLKINVEKEIEKDKQIILRAHNLDLGDKVPSEEDTEKLLNDFREIDQRFLKDISTLASSIVIHYHDIEQYRRRRIASTLDLTYRILHKWDRSTGFRTAVALVYSREEFDSLIHDIFDLYIKETRMLSESVKIPGKLRFARDALTRKVSSVMETVAAELTRELTSRVFAHGNPDRSR